MKRRLLTIVIAFCISFVSMVALSLFSMERYTTYTNYSDAVEHSDSVIILMRAADVSLRDIGLTERGYMLTHDTMYLRSLNKAVDSINRVVNELGTLTEDNPEQRKNIALLKAAIAIIGPVKILFR